MKYTPQQYAKALVDLTKSEQELNDFIIELEIFAKALKKESKLAAILKNPERVYRITIRFGTREKFETQNYIFSFGEIGFRREIPENQESSEK